MVRCKEWMCDGGVVGKIGGRGVGPAEGQLASCRCIKCTGNSPTLFTSHSNFECDVMSGLTIRRVTLWFAGGFMFRIDDRRVGRGGDAGGEPVHTESDIVVCRVDLRFAVMAEMAEWGVRTLEVSPCHCCYQEKEVFFKVWGRVGDVRLIIFTTTMNKIVGQ